MLSTQLISKIVSSAKGFLSPNSVWTFRYDNGELFRGIGENICWESRDSDDSKFFRALYEEKRFNYDFMVTKLAANCGDFFRTWIIYWNLPVDWKTVKNNSRYQNTTSPYNESGMKRMDQLVKLCDSLGIHMMLAFESHAGYCKVCNVAKSDLLGCYFHKVNAIEALFFKVDDEKYKRPFCKSFSNVSVAN